MPPEPLIWRHLTWSVAGNSGTDMDIEPPALAAVIEWRSGLHKGTTSAIDIAQH